MSVPKAFALARPRTTAVSLAPWLLGAIALSLLLQCWLAFTRQINWDEFWFLSRLYQYREGALSASLQTFYVHLFAWLPHVSNNVIGRIVSARVLMLGLEAGTFALIYSSARRFVSREAALLGLFTYASLNYVLIHGAAFRADPIATFLLMSSVALFLAPQPAWKSMIAGALAMALAGLVTAKSVFYLPPIAAILLWRFIESDNRRAFALKLGAAAAISMLAFAAAFVLHRASLAPPRPGSAVSTGFVIGMAFAPGAFARTWPYMSAAMIGNPATFAAAALGIRQCISETAKARLRSLALLSFAFPLLTLFFYRNSFPYYYPFALAPAAILACLAFDRMQYVWERAAWALACAVFLIIQFANALSPGQAAERETLAAVRKIFPQAAAYFDYCGMASDYRHAGFFMSTWGIERYRLMGKPVFREAIAGKDPPLFVIADTPVLHEALAPGSEDIGDGYKLFSADARALRANYVHHWGAIWVAGKDLGALGAARAVAIEIPGSYTIEASAPVLIDNVTYKPSTIVRLARGTHNVQSAIEQHVILRYGDHLFRPASPPPGDIFEGF